MKRAPQDYAELARLGHKRKREYDKLFKELYYPKVIREYEENGLKVRVFESRPAMGILGDRIFMGSKGVRVLEDA